MISSGGGNMCYPQMINITNKDGKPYIEAADTDGVWIKYRIGNRGCAIEIDFAKVPEFDSLTAELFDAAFLIASDVVIEFINNNQNMFSEKQRLIRFRYGNLKSVIVVVNLGKSLLSKEKYENYLSCLVNISHCTTSKKRYRECCDSEEETDYDHEQKEKSSKHSCHRHKRGEKDSCSRRISDSPSHKKRHIEVKTKKLREKEIELSPEREVPAILSQQTECYAGTTGIHTSTTGDLVSNSTTSILSGVRDGLTIEETIFQRRMENRENLLLEYEKTREGKIIRRGFGGDRYSVYNFMQQKQHMCWSCSNLFSIIPGKRLVCDECADKIVGIRGKKCDRCGRSDRLMIRHGLTFRNRFCAICEHK